MTNPAFTVDDRVRYRQQLATVQHVSAGGDVAIVRLDDGELVATATGAGGGQADGVHQHQPNSIAGGDSKRQGTENKCQVK